MPTYTVVKPFSTVKATPEAKQQYVNVGDTLLFNPDEGTGITSVYRGYHHVADIAMVPDDINWMLFNGYIQVSLVTVNPSKVALGLDHVDNTSDMDKPVSTAVAIALSNKENFANKGIPNGYASLDSKGKLLNSQLPAISIIDTYTATNLQEMLSVDAEHGDVCIRADLSKTFILSGDNPAELSQWTEMLTPPSPVLSVNGQIGAVDIDLISKVTPLGVDFERYTLSTDSTKSWHGWWDEDGHIHFETVAGSGADIFFHPDGGTVHLNTSLDVSGNGEIHASGRINSNYDPIDGTPALWLSSNLTPSTHKDYIFINPPAGMVFDHFLHFLKTDGSDALTVDFSGNVSLAGNLSVGGSPDVVLQRDGAATLALRNGIHPQTFNVYNTYTDAANYERGFLKWTGSSFNIGTERAGTGVDKIIQFMIGGTARLGLGLSTLFPSSNNTYDLGMGGNRFRTGYFGTSVDSPLFLAGDGTAAAPGMAFSGDTTAGFYRLDAYNIVSTRNFQSTGNMLAAGYLKGTHLILGADSYLWRSAANVLNMGSGTSDSSATLKLGILLAGDGTQAAPSLAFATDPTYGFYKGNNFIGVTQQVVANSSISASSLNAGSGGSLSIGWDARLYRDAANVLALRNGTNAQAFNIYNTYTDTSNYERGVLKWSGNFLHIGTEKGGSGQVRGVLVDVGGSSVFAVNSNAIWPFTHNTVDLGISGTAFRSIYAGTSVSAPLVASSGTDLTLSQTGDTYGTTSLTLKNRIGLNGALFKNSGLDLIDFGFETNSGAYSVIRFEHRSNELLNTGNSDGEFQLCGTSGSYTSFGKSATVLGSTLLFKADNTKDIGYPATARPANIYAGTKVEAPILNATTEVQVAGVPQAKVVARVALTGQTAAIPETALFTPDGVHQYRVTTSLMITQTTATAGTVGSVYIKYNNGFTDRSDNTNTAMNANAVASASSVLSVVAGSSKPVGYSVSYSATGGSCTYCLYLVVEQLQ
jgi:hypothetical protein